jgi:kynurenine formamidase
MIFPGLSNYKPISPTWKSCPLIGATLNALPVKIKGGMGAPTRVVTLLP